MKEKILIMLPTGKTGYVTTVELLKEGYPVKIYVRSRNRKAMELEKLGAEAAIGQFNNPLQLTTALKDVRKVYYNHPVMPGMAGNVQTFIHAARISKIEAIVFMGQRIAEFDALLKDPIPYFGQKLFPTGSKSISPVEMAEIFSKVSGRKIKVVPTPDWLFLKAGIMGRKKLGLDTYTIVQSGLPILVGDAFWEKFRSGSKPNGIYGESDIAHIKQLLAITLDQLETDYNNHSFGNYTAWSTRFGKRVANIDDGLEFLLFHERLHSGTIIKLQKSLC